MRAVRGPFLRERLLVVTVLAAMTAAAAAIPGLNAPFSRLANYEGDTGAPVTSVPVDAAAIERAARLLPRGTTFAHHVGGDPLGQLDHDVIGIARLYFLPSVLVYDPADAEWLLSYKAERLVPEGLRARGSRRVGDGIFLVRLA